MNMSKCVWGFVFLPVAIAPVYAAGPELSTVNRRQLAEDYGKLPLSFEVNQGQADQQVRFLSRGSGYGFYLTARGAVLALQNQQSQHGEQANTAVLRMGLIGANAGAAINGVDRLPGTSNYFIGNDAKRWHTNVPTYAAVKYASVYRGIDLIYHGEQRQLEYDFVVGEGANPGCIQLSFDGAKTVSIDRSGDLHIVTGGDKAVVMRAPVAYQESEGRRTPVTAGYVLHSRTRVGLRLGDYDRSRLLVIDPTLVYSTYLGGLTRGLAIAVDSTGSAFVTGNTASADFPTTPGALQTTLKGSGSSDFGDAFVTKFSPDGSTLVYSTYLGGSADDVGNSIAIDASGNAYVTGQTLSADFPTAKPFQPSCLTVNNGECAAAFVSKLNADGSALLYSTYLGGHGGQTGASIALDSNRNAYVSGSTTASDFPTTSGAFQQQCISCAATGSYNAFVTKLNAQGSALVYSTFLDGIGPADYSGAGGIAVDASGDAYVAGSTYATDFPTTAGAFQTVYAGGQFDGFVTKLNAAGSALVYSTYLGGSQGDSVGPIAVDSSGSAYVTGDTFSTDFPITPGAFQTNFLATSSNFLVDPFVTKLNPSGTSLVYSTFLGVGEGLAIAIDTAGNAYIAGAAGSIPTVNPIQAANAGDSDAFVTELNSAGSAALFSTYLGGPNNDWAAGVAVAGGDIYIAGAASPGFPTTTSAFQTTFTGIEDAIVCKIRLGIQFATFKPLLRLDVQKGAFDLKARFAAGEGGTINPLTDAVTLGIGPYSVTIPAGSFKRQGEHYRFEGVIAGVHLEVSIVHLCRQRGDRDSDQPEDPNCHPCEANEAPYELTAEGNGANLSGITNPVAVTLSIGNNTGSAEVMAEFTKSE